jgi:trehalose 6-phosphate phosphatase
MSQQNPLRPLQERIEDLAQVPILLVACDFDGTIAPIVSHPSEAQPNREAIVAMSLLAAMPQTHVAVISGRALKDLSSRTQDAENLHLVGSHGSEFDPGFASGLPRDAVELLGRLSSGLATISNQCPGSFVEEKPAGVTFHYRNADDSSCKVALDAILAGPATLPGVFVRHGKKMVELSVMEMNKGTALSGMRQRLGASAVIFLGDDLTDEDAFATLSGPDIGVKIGDGATLASYRIGDPVDVARILALIAERRSEWLTGAHAVPIEQHSFLSDQRTFAIVASSGRVSWLCVPRLDSSAVFAELLGGAPAGHFDILSPNRGPPKSQQYLGDTFILETRWDSFSVVDYLDCSDERVFQRAGRTDLIRVIQGKGPVHIRFAPRFDFGRVATLLRAEANGLIVEGSPDPMCLRSGDVQWRIIEQGQHQSAEAIVDPQDAPVILELRYGTANLAPVSQSEPERRRRSEEFWSRWAQSLSLPAIYTEKVRRSALVIKALCYGPTGSIAAAATTSLPESIGGVRNWDYRYCWPRDAALAAAALANLGTTGIAMRFLDWLLGILDHSESPDRLRPVYTVTGGHLATEAEIGALPGYRGSRPIRIGNAAAGQLQLDVFGPIVDLIAILAKRGCALSSEHWRLVEMMVEAVEKRWREPDHGIWEVRMNKRHHVHSRVMCWTTVDRALGVAEYLGRKRPEWPALRDAIAQDVLENGYSQQLGIFTAAYGEQTLDASALSVGLSGLLPPNDPRFINTVNHVDAELRRGPTVFRYRYDDGLPGTEGGFHLCTSWLIESLAMIGRTSDAFKLMDEFVRLAGPTGLYSEEYDPGSGIALGNFPQAYSHLGLINAAIRLAQTPQA